MGIKTWLNKILKKDTYQIVPIPIYRLETPDKIVETKIQPVKIPTIFDVSERLANLSRDISILKNEMVSKSWFKNEFEDISPSIIDKLNEITNNLRSLQESFTNFTNLLSSKLSNFTKDSTVRFSDVNHFSMPLDTSEIIYKIVKAHKKIRYKDIKKQIPVSDPTLSKYLKILVFNKKIRRKKVGKAVFYEPR
jgi:hypothetical protein